MAGITLATLSSAGVLERFTIVNTGGLELTALCVLNTGVQALKSILASGSRPSHVRRALLCIIATAGFDTTLLELTAIGLTGVVKLISTGRKSGETKKDDDSIQWRLR
jgi:hypothetical protein